VDQVSTPPGLQLAGGFSNRPKDNEVRRELTMSKLSVVVFGMLLIVAGVCIAQEPAGTYGLGGIPDPYAGPTPSGMRFGETGQIVSVQTGDEAGPALGGPYAGYLAGGPGCPGCGIAVHGPPCDPQWSGPCIDWKLVGWYSSFHDKNHGGCGGHGCRCRAGCY
jgi:hypothetical protein